VRCGGVGQNGRGGHAHNDLLSYELSRAEPIIVDSGTYAYTSDVEARDAFRSTAAHNTVRLDGEETNPIPEGGVFWLPSAARPVLVEEALNERHPRLVVAHDGYRRLRPPVEHRRAFRLNRDTGELEVEDSLLGAGCRLIESFIHLAPATVAFAIGNRVEATLRETMITLSFTGYASVQVVDGWVSDRFGVRERAPVVIARIDRTLPAVLSYRITPGLGPVTAWVPAAEAMA
jgi:uncharacterized heparinase superfamily protein